MNQDKCVHPLKDRKNHIIPKADSSYYSAIVCDKCGKVLYSDENKEQTSFIKFST